MSKTPGTTTPADSDNTPFNADAQIKLQTAHDAIQHPDKFAEIFCNAAQSQVSIKQYIRQELQESLTSDVKTKDAMRVIIKQHFDEDWRTWLKSAWGKFAILIWTLIVAWLTHALIK